MPYVTSIERMAREEGLQEGKFRGLQEGELRGLQEGELRGLRQGIEVALELKFGAAGLELLPLVQSEERVDVLRAVQRAIRTARSLAEVRELLR
jgi:hypothetical protein